MQVSSDSPEISKFKKKINELWNNLENALPVDVLVYTPLNFVWLLGLITRCETEHRRQNTRAVEYLQNMGSVSESTPAWRLWVLEMAFS